MSKVIVFTDAQEMAQKHPDTFKAPNLEQLKSLKTGDFVKVCINPERFWVEIETIDENFITGRIDNDLIYSDEHGLKFNDQIKFEPRHVYQIMGK